MIRLFLIFTLLLKQTKIYPEKPPFIAACLLASLLFCKGIFAQNPSIKCYFNHRVNTTISTGLNAAYLDASFPDTISAYISRAKFTVDIAMYNYSSNTFN